MVTKTPYLTKSRFVAGLNCHKRLWLSFHEPAPYIEPEPGSIQAIGTEFGILAQNLFTEGVLVDQKPWEHAQAVQRTRDLMADPNVPAIFEGAFEHSGLRIRADLIERLENDNWALYEVKSSKQPKESHYWDLAVQAHVMSGAGLNVAKTVLIHVNGEYVRGPDGIDCDLLFTRTDLTQDLKDFLPGVPDQIEKFHQILSSPKVPEIEPGKHCPGYCEFLDQCRAGKPKDWVIHLPNLRADKYQTLVELGCTTIGQVPDDIDLTDLQARVRDSHRSGSEFISNSLHQVLEDLSPPAYYLDFEALAPAIPLYPGTKPFQRVPFQWSVHHLDADGQLTHREYLATDGTDPRADLAEALIDAVGTSQEPIIVYTSYEKGVINDLANNNPDLAGPLLAIVDRLLDLHALIKAHFYHPDFSGSFSIKAVGPALIPDLGYDQLDAVADGMAAAGAFYSISAGQVGPGQDPEAIRHDLLRYCELDSLAMVKVYQALTERCAN